jgi:hypothetical protein
MGLLDVFKRSRSSVLLKPRAFALTIAGHGVEARARLPLAAAHLSDGTLVFGPFDLPAARSSGQIRTALIQPGSAPSAELTPHSTSDSGIVTYTSEERGTTKLVLGAGQRDHGELLASFGPAPHAAIWRIITDQIDLWWPAGFSLRATGDVNAPDGPFHLAHDGSPHDAIHLWGPLAGDNIPPPERLQAGGGTRIDAGSLAGAERPVKHYTFESDASAQRYYYVHLDAQVIYLVRARAAIDSAAVVFKAADVVCASLKPRF